MPSLFSSPAKPPALPAVSPPPNPATDPATLAAAETQRQSSGLGYASTMLADPGFGTRPLGAGTSLVPAPTPNANRQSLTGATGA